MYYLGITSNDNALNKCGRVEYWPNLAENTDKRRDLATTVTNLLIPSKGNIGTTEERSASQ